MVLPLGQKKEYVKGPVREKQTVAVREPDWVKKMAHAMAADLVSEKAR